MATVGMPGFDGGAGAAPAPAGRDWRARLPFFYGWVIVAAAVVSLALSYAVWYSFSVFFVALLEEFRWSRADAAGAGSFFIIVTGIAAAGAGALADRFGPGRVVAAGGVVAAAGLVACSRLTELWQFYLTYGVLTATGVSLAGWTPCVTMINRWFSIRIGVALGLGSGGVGVGILVVVPLVQAIIGGAGWRTAYVALAALVLVGLVPTGLLLLRGRPEDLGQQLDGGRPSSRPMKARAGSPGQKSIEVVDREWVSRSWTLGSALRTGRYWLLGLVKLTGSIATQMVFVHQVAYLVDGGVDRMAAASLVGLVGFLSVGAKVMWGWAADTLGREVTYTLGSAALALAVGLLVLVQLVPFPGLLYLYAIVFALGYGVSAPLYPVVTADLFAGRRFGSIYGSINAFSGFGSGLGAWFGGYVFDQTGSYVAAFGVAAAAKVASAAVLWAVAPRKIRRVASA